MVRPWSFPFLLVLAACEQSVAGLDGGQERASPFEVGMSTEMGVPHNDEPSPACTSMPEASSELATWTPGAGTAVVLDGPTCLPTEVSLSVAGGDGGYRWLSTASLPDGAFFIDPDRATARLVLPPGFVGEIEVEVHAERENVATSIRSPERAGPAWWPIVRDEPRALVVADACSGRVRAVAALSEGASVASGERYLYYTAPSGAETEVWRASLRSDEVERSIVGRLPGTRATLRGRPSRFGGIEVSMEGRGYLLGSVSGRSPLELEPGERLRQHALSSGDDLWLVNTREGLPKVYVSDGTSATLGRRSTRWAQLSSRTIVVDDFSSVSLYDLRGRRLAWIPADAELNPGFGGIDGWFHARDTDRSFELIRLEQGCVHRRPAPGPASGLRWFASGRGGTAFRGGSQPLIWVIRDDGSVTFGSPPVIGTPDQGAFQPNGHRVLVRGFDPEVSLLVVLDAAGNASRVSSLNDTGPEGGFRVNQLSPDGLLMTEYAANRVLLTRAERDRRLLLAVEGRPDIFWHPSGLAAAVVSEGTTTLLSLGAQDEVRLHALQGEALGFPRWRAP